MNLHHSVVNPGAFDLERSGRTHFECLNHAVTGINIETGLEEIGRRRGSRSAGHEPSLERGIRGELARLPHVDAMTADNVHTGRRDQLRVHDQHSHTHSGRHRVLASRSFEFPYLQKYIRCQCGVSICDSASIRPDVSQLTHCDI